MTRWLVVLGLAVTSAGCRTPGNVYAPYGPACVPAPGTGAVGSPYYQAPAYQTPGYPAYQTPAYPTAPTTPAYGVPYGVPAQQVPSFNTAPSFQGSSSRNILPGGPAYAAAPISISPYMANEGLWSSDAVPVAGYPVSAYPVVSAPVADERNDDPISIRPSGQLIASGARFRRNDSLDWGSVQQASAAIPYAGTYDNVRPATYTAPTIAGNPVQYASPTFGTEYVLDPYASSYDPYAGASVGSVASAERWTPRR